MVGDPFTSASVHWFEIRGYVKIYCASGNELPRFPGVDLWVSLRETGCELENCEETPVNILPLVVKDKLTG